MVPHSDPIITGRPAIKQPPRYRAGGQVERTDLGDGWSIFTADPLGPPTPEELPVALSQALARWLRAIPSVCVRSVWPITQGGNTVAVHVWWAQST